MTEMASAADVRAAVKRAMDGTIGIRNPKSPVLDAAKAAAESVAEQLDAAADRAAVLAELGEDQPGDLRAWLFELPSFLAKKGREQEGQALCDRLAPLLGAEYVEAERVLVHWEAGNRDEARTLSEKLLADHPDHAWVHLRAGTIAERSKNGKTALASYQKSLELARARHAEDADAGAQDLRFAYDALIGFHQSQNEAHEAVELSRQMMEDLPELEEEMRTEQIVNEAPKVGRNDPCTCGSGKKFKKCCGAPA